MHALYHEGNHKSGNEGAHSEQSQLGKLTFGTLTHKYMARAFSLPRLNGFASKAETLLYALQALLKGIVH